MVPHCSEMMTLVWYCYLAIALISTFRIFLADFPWARDQCVASARWSFSPYYPKILCLLVPRFYFVVPSQFFASFSVRRLHFLLFRLPGRFCFVDHVDFSAFNPKIICFPVSFPVWALLCSFSLHFLSEDFIFCYSGCPEASAESVSVCRFSNLAIFFPVERLFPIQLTWFSSSGWHCCFPFPFRPYLAAKVLCFSAELSVFFADYLIPLHCWISFQIAETGHQFSLAFRPESFCFC